MHINRGLKKRLYIVYSYNNEKELNTLLNVAAYAKNLFPLKEKKTFTLIRSSIFTLFCSSLKRTSIESKLFGGPTFSISCSILKFVKARSRDALRDL